MAAVPLIGGHRLAGNSLASRSGRAGLRFWDVSLRLYTTQLVDEITGAELEVLSVPAKTAQRAGITSIEQLTALLPDRESIQWFRHDLSFPTAVRGRPLLLLDLSSVMERAQPARDAEQVLMIGLARSPEDQPVVARLLQALDDASAIVTEASAPSGLDLVGVAAVVTAVAATGLGPVGIVVGIGTILIVRVLWGPAEEAGDMLRRRIRHKFGRR